VTLEDSELQRNNANLIQQVVEGMQQAVSVETNTHDSKTYETQQHLHAQLQQMQESMNLLQAQLASQQDQTIASNQDRFQQARGYQGGGYQGRGYQGRRYQGLGYQGRGYQSRGGRENARPRNTSIYCWTHGDCGHPSVECLDKLNGHQNNATFQNKKGGDTKNC
jgi:hypothetical protein